MLRDGDEAVLNEADPNGDPDDEELDIGELDVNAGNVDSTLIKATVSVKQWDCWLLRGRREPLNSMGLYHYTMFVYQKRSTEGCERLHYAFVCRLAPAMQSCGATNSRRRML